jgi:hypothetical protein
MPDLTETTEYLKTIMNSKMGGYVIWGAFLALFLGVLYFGSRATGWHKLAKHYPCRNPYQETWITQPDFFDKDSGGLNLRFNTSESEDAIKLGADYQGLYLTMSLGFRFFHPPLFVPWEDVRTVWTKAAPWLKEKNLLVITFAEQPDIPLEVDRHVAGEMEKRALGRWSVP